MLNLIFFGSSQYSLIILQEIIKIKDFNLLAIVTKPDKATGRKQQVTPNPVANFAYQNNLKLLPTNEFDSNFKKKLKDMKADLYLVVAFGPPFFDQEMIHFPKYKIVNIHPSPLPKYRGATPGPWQIINGETKSSVCFFQIDPLPDHGPIISQFPFDISSTETASSFYQKAFELAAIKLKDTLKGYLSNSIKLKNQDHQKKSYFPKLDKNSAQINWSWDLTKIERFIRALNPWPIAWTYIKNQQGDILKMKILSSIVANQKLIPISVQIEGKKITNWTEIKNYYSIIYQQ